MMLLVIEGSNVMKELIWVDPNHAPHGPWERHRPFVDLNFKCLAIPVKTAGSDLKLAAVACNRLLAAFGHGPSACTASIERDIDRTVVLWIGVWIFLKCPVVIRREDTTNKRDDG